MNSTKMRKLNYRKTAYTICFLLTIGFITAATKHEKYYSAAPLEPQSEYKKIIEAFKNSSHLNVSGTIRIYDKENNNALKEENGFYYERDGNAYYSQISYLRTFCDGNIVMQLDTVNRYIIISKLNDKKNQPAAQQSIDVFFNDTSTFKITGTVSLSGKNRTLTIQNDLNPKVKMMRVTYDGSSYKVLASEIEFWKSTSVEELSNPDKIWLAKVSYSYSAKPSQIKEMMRKVVAIDSQNHVTINAKYKGYQVRSGF